jgi:hypothetical protein
MSFGNNIKIEKYNEDRIQLIKLNLEHHIATGSPRLYEIQVDGMKAVPKTTDITQFSNYEIYLSEETDELKIHLFQGNSHKYDGFTFKCNTQSIAKTPSLEGITQSVDVQIKQALQAKAFEDALRKVEVLETELSEMQDYIDTLEDKFEKLTRQHFDLQNEKPKATEKMVNMMVEGFMHIAKRNPSALGNIPVIGKLLATGVESQLANENEMLQFQLHEQKQKLEQLSGAMPQQNQSTFTQENETE